MMCRLSIVCLLAALLLCPDVSAQTVTKIADVVVGNNVPVYGMRRTNNGQYVACTLDSTRVVRIRTFPTVWRDTVVLPSTMKKPMVIGVSPFHTFMVYTASGDGRRRLVALEHSDSTWRDLSSILPPTHPTLGFLRSSYESRVFTATGQTTVAITGLYESSAAPARILYRSVIADVQTLAPLKVYDSVNVRGVKPGGGAYYSMGPAPDSGMQQCTYFDAATGERLYAVRCGPTYTDPTGIDHIMYSYTSIGQADGPPSPRAAGGRWLESCFASPNVFLARRSHDTVEDIELYDVLQRSATLIDTNIENATADDVEQRIAVAHRSPTRIVVYDINGVVGREGLGCFRSADAADVYGSVSYGATYLGQRRMNKITATIGNRVYQMNDRTQVLSLSVDSPQDVPFHAVATDSNGMVADTDSMVPLRVRYPGDYVSSTRVGHAVREMAFSADERSLAVVSDSATTIIPLRGADVPVFDTATVIPVLGTTLHVTQSTLLPADTYVCSILRGEDSSSTVYGRWIHQVAVHAQRRDTSLIRSVWLEPDVSPTNVRTVSNARDNLIGLCVNGTSADRGVIYLSSNASGSWMPDGDTSGINAPVSGRVDLALSGHVVGVGSNGRVIMKRRSDGASIIDVNVGRAPALVINDSTVLSLAGPWRNRGGVWAMEMGPLWGLNTVDVVRLSSAFSALVSSNNNSAYTGYIVDNTSMSIVDTLGRGFVNATCAIYSSRYRGLFIGHSSGIIGFVPLPSQYLQPTSVAEREQLHSSEPITSCAVYTVQGSKVAEMSVDSTADVGAWLPVGLAQGLYIVVYSNDRGAVRTQSVCVMR